MKALKVMTVVVAVGLFSVSAFGQDECSSPITPATTVDICIQTPNVTDPWGTCWTAYGINSAWIDFVATDTAHRLRTDLYSGGSDSMFAVYSGDCGSLVEIGCSNDEAGPGGYLGDICVGDLTPGTTYHIQLHNWLDGDQYGPQYNPCSVYGYDIFRVDLEAAYGTICGDNVVSCLGDEECDGTDIGSCITGTICDGDCTCPDPICGNNIKEAGEECDGTDDSACPSLCQGDCTCPEAPALPIWGIVGLGVLLAGGGATAVARRRKKA